MDPPIASAPVRERVPYFERPRQPRDWRWWVGGFGRTLIVTGLLMFGFVAYQLWGTGIQTARVQGELRKQLESVVPTLPPSTDTTLPPTDGSSPVDTTVPRAEAAPAVANGSPLGYIKIPSIDVDWAFVEGVKAKDIEKGPGHFRESPMPGQIGNAAIAGHRTTHGQPFFNLDKVSPGDEIITITDAGTHVYEITESLVVSPTDYAAVVPPFMADTATLTLVTCTPAYTARERLIIRAVIVPEKSDQLYLPPAKLPDPDPGVGGPNDTTDTGTTLPGGTEGPDLGSPSTDDPADDAFADDTAFSGGWFDDMAAVPQIIGWGLILIAIVIGAYLLGRRVRRLSVSILAGLVPFVIALYFWYENIYRLLPPGL